MTLLADFLKDSNGKTWRVYPGPDGELRITDVNVESAAEDEFSKPIYIATTWGNPSYTIPGYNVVYWTLKDSAGTTWYVYPNSLGELVITNVEPPMTAGIWMDCDYTSLEATAVVGGEIYTAMKDADLTAWYVYPNSLGELIITTVQPS